MNPDLVIAWAKVIFSALGSAALIPFAIYFAKYFWDVRRWTVFERSIQEWAVDELTDEDWRAIAATKLFEANFEPTRIADLIEPAVWYAKGRASQEVTGKIGFRDDEKDKHGRNRTPPPH